TPKVLMMLILKDIIWKDEYLLVTCDVSSLYSIIPHNIGIQAVQYFLEQSGFKQQQIDFILDGILLILENNFFWFKDSFFIQITGTAMGTKFAPSYANLFMAYWEDKIIFPHLAAKNLVSYHRYIDDIFFIWKGGEESLNLFLNDLNVNSWGIFLTSTYSTNHINFLDLEVFISNSTINTRNHFKDVDANSYIEMSSCHYPPWLKNVPKSQFLRVRRNCTQEIDYISQAERIKEQFLDKGYEIDTLQNCIEEVKKIDRKDLIRYKKPHNRTTDKHTFNMPFICNHSGNNHKINKIVTKYWPILKEDPILSQILPNRPKMVYRGCKNLKQILVKSSLRTQPPTHFLNKNKGFYGCGSCLACRETNSTKRHITSFTYKDKKEFTIKDQLTCFSKCVIYILKCPCNLIYVGRTIRCLHTRIAEHVRNIKKGLETHSVSQHYKKCHNSNPRNLMFCAIKSVSKNWRGGDFNKRIGEEEMRCIYNFNTLIPNGAMSDHIYFVAETHPNEILKDIIWKDEYLLVTCDVSSLYSIIPHNIGIQAVQYFLEQSGFKQQQIDFILDGILLILENNFFWFKDSFFIQITGTAMGTKFAPSYANLFMALCPITYILWLEDSLSERGVGYSREQKMG
ncbi:Hypothetical predicted protein, partial [Pelobates cultripes]